MFFSLSFPSPSPQLVAPKKEQKKRIVKYRELSKNIGMYPFYVRVRRFNHTCLILFVSVNISKYTLSNFHQLIQIDRLKTKHMDLNT